ncbi:spore germination protein GerPE [Priestia filamentosa]|uniref:spore germination protein GerPE n=1 Tax=Priestia filamentosa TaxID=1402861 RepID=UPI0023494A00|nr:spore germination protein GerPE [Priestia filamentosa]WCM16442.1 spore germination protein GerPE [Priestia filamentosa]
MRTSKVDWFRMNSLTSSSIFNIGDSAHIRSSAKVIAIQREAELFFGREGNFNDYTLFKRSYPLLTLKRIPTVKYNESNIIHVGSVRVTGASTSSVVQIGSTNDIKCYSRVKHVRQLLSDRREKEQEEREEG